MIIDPITILSRACFRSQRARSTRGEDAHDAKDNIEQGQRVSHQSPHPAHAGHRTEHARGTVGTPANRGNCQEISEQGIHGNEDTNQTGKNQRKETVAQDTGGAREGQGSGEMTGGGGIGHRRFVVRVVVVRVSGVGGRSCVEGRRHEAKNHVQGNCAKDRHTVDIAIEDLSGEEKESAVQDDVKQCSVEITIVHKMVIDRSKRIENRQSLVDTPVSGAHKKGEIAPPISTYLSPDMFKVDS